MRRGEVTRETSETQITMNLELDGQGTSDISTGVGFLDHMLELFARHGLFDLEVRCKGDLEIDAHHTVEDVGICLGLTVKEALGSAMGIKRYGWVVLPMDEALAEVAIDLSNRPFLVYHLPSVLTAVGSFDQGLAKEFFRAFAVKGGMNLHINVKYGENEHHVLESIYKSTGRALKQAVSIDKNRTGVRSSKGVL